MKTRANPRSPRPLAGLASRIWRSPVVYEAARAQEAGIAVNLLTFAPTRRTPTPRSGFGAAPLASTILVPYLRLRRQTSGTRIEYAGGMTVHSAPANTGYMRGRHMRLLEFGTRLALGFRRHRRPGW